MFLPGRRDLLSHSQYRLGMATVGRPYGAYGVSARRLLARSVRLASIDRNAFVLQARYASHPRDARGCALQSHQRISSDFVER